jgi:pilus assembly protein CpaB
MLIRRLLLAVGFLALAAGIVLTVLSLRTPRETNVVAAGPAAVAKQTVLTAAHDLPAATLLRSDDIKWADMAVGQVPAGAIVRSPTTAETDLLGAATSRALKAGEAIPGDVVIRPTEAGFMAAVLTPGMRAISIQIDAAAVGAGLIQPNDRVDVLLTQTLHEGGSTAALRSVGETILHDLRVIAVDQTHMLGVEQERKATVTTAPRVPQIVTLEVTTQQAEKLMVAHQLGRLQLTLRGLAETTDAGPPVAPTYATDVSPALRYLSEEAGGGGPGKPVAEGGVPGAPAAPVAIAIIRGQKPAKEMRTDTLCYSERSHTTVHCRDEPVTPTNATGTPASGEGTPAGGDTPEPAAPGKSGALSTRPTALPT